MERTVKNAGHAEAAPLGSQAGRGTCKNRSEIRHF